MEQQCHRSVSGGSDDAARSARQARAEGKRPLRRKTQDRIGANLARQTKGDATRLRNEWASLVGAKNATAVELMRKVDPNASTMPLDRPQAQRDKDIATIQAATTPRRSEVLADPNDERRRPQVTPKPVASLMYGESPPAARMGAASVVAQAQSAQADRLASVTNDNRSTSSSSAEAHFHGDMIFNQCRK